MLFNSVEYIALLIGVLVCYWSLSSLRARQWLVFVASLYFYMSWSRVFILVLLALIAVNWFFGIFIERHRSKLALWLVISINLVLLAYFKYFNFLIENFDYLLKFIGPEWALSKLSIILPLGVSFYVFELISYQVDVFRGKINHENDSLAFAIFVLFFPHLIAGPICRAGQFLPQLHVKQGLDGEKIYNGLYWFLAGFVLKSAIADGIAPFVNVIFDAPDQYSGFDNLMATTGFGIQIICDFWGYSLMALGAALLFGYILPHNFNFPYAALSIRDFWRRWHMTLSSWLRDYLYIGLGGSRTDAEWKTQRNLIVTMLLGGLWHGASWNFIIWGGIHGVALAVNRWFELAAVDNNLIKFLRWPPFAWLLTMSVVFLSWIFFRAINLDHSLLMVVRILSPASGWFESKLSAVFFELLLLYFPLQWLIHYTTYRINMARQDIRWQLPSVALLNALAWLYYVNGDDFIYFQF